MRNLGGIGTGNRRQAGSVIRGSHISRFSAGTNRGVRRLVGQGRVVWSGHYIRWP